MNCNGLLNQTSVGLILDYGPAFAAALFIGAVAAIVAGTSR
jgi:hypothetical protein